MNELIERALGWFNWVACVHACTCERKGTWIWDLAWRCGLWGISFRFWDKTCV